MNTTCSYCGLPVPGLLWPRRANDKPDKLYCCYGCRFADAVDRSRADPGQAGGTLTRLGWGVFFAMNVMVFAMALWSHDVYAAEEDGAVAAALTGLFRYLSLLFALPVLLLLGGPLLENACSGLRRGYVSMDLLLLIGVAASYIYSAASVVKDSGPVYFEVGCMILVLVTLGRWLEASCKLKAMRALESLQKLLPETARRIHDGHEESVALELIDVGDVIRVLPGERIPCDGALRSSSATVDEQILSGESKPLTKTEGDRVIGGSLNLDSPLLIEVGATPENGAIGCMVELIRHAQQTKGRFERLADRVSAWFLPAVIVVSLATFGVHFSWYGFEKAMLAAFAVLLIACPCALGIATPLALWCALGRAAQSQVLFRDSKSLEQLAGVRAVFFDKTGTLTTGDCRVAAFFGVSDENRDEVVRRAALLAANANHVYSRAITRFCEAKADSQQLEHLFSLKNVPGRGLVALPEADREIVLGSFSFLREKGLAVPDSLSNQISAIRRTGKPMSCIGWGSIVQGVFVFQEELRAEAALSVQGLRDEGLHVCVLTGDQEASAECLQIGAPVHAGLLPEDKCTQIRAARRKLGPVAMVGDGINDGAALASADVGIAMGCGADVARACADVCLLGNDLLRVPWAIAFARQTVRVIRQNLFWAFAYNLVGIGFACTGMLNPVLAAAAMVTSSLLVVANSARLAHSDEPATYAAPQENELERSVFAEAQQ